MGESEIPDNMILNNEPVNCYDISERFAEFFEKKVGDILNHEIPLTWLNMSIDTFKIHCKKLYLSLV